MRSGFSSLVGLVWVVVGLIVASRHGYFAHLISVMPILSAILAVLLWPLILLGVNLHIR
jgi:ABC-type anion transport system duplicated permease subunit